MASCPRLRPTTMLQVGRSSLLLRLLQAELFYFATTKIGIGCGIVAATTFRRRAHSTCRHDGTAVISDFRPRIGNRCIHWAHSVDFRASILDFRPRLANRCSQKAKTVANRASILDFKPRLGNRCNNASLSRAGKQSTVPHLIFGKVEENL